MAQICRTCMFHDKEMIPIYSPMNWPPVDVMLMAIASIKLLPDDMLPSNICVTCLQALQSAYSFKTQVLQTNALLQQAHAVKLHALQANEDGSLVHRNTDIPQGPFEVKIEPCDDDSRYIANNFQVKEEICSDTEFVHIKRPPSACDVQPAIVQFPSNCDIPTRPSFEEDPGMINHFQEMSKHTLTEETSRTTSQHEFVNANIKRSPSTCDIQPIIDHNSFNETSGFLPMHNSSQQDSKMIFRYEANGNNVNEYFHSLKHAEKTLNREEMPEFLSHQQEHFPASLEDRKKVYTLHQVQQQQHADQEMDSELDIDDYSSSEDDEPEAKPAVNTSKGSGVKESKPFKCHECDYAFAKLSALKVHIRVHTGEKPFVCEYCQAQFAHKPSLKDHLRTHTDGNDRPFKCEICGKGFTWSNSLKVHMITHSGEKPFQCTHCDATFAHKCNLKNHIATHTGEVRLKTHICEICGKRYGRSNSLKIHMRVHTGERPFKCPYCDATYARNCHLKNHLFSHTGEKRPKLHICPICGKRCTRSQHLREHMITHTKERSYKCQQCDAAFAHAKTLREHLKKHAEEASQKLIDLSKESIS